MGKRQLAIFDYVEMRKDDSLLYQIQMLAPGAEISVGELKVERTERFYQVSLDGEFEAIFTVDKECYDFVRIIVSEQMDKGAEEDA